MKTKYGHEVIELKSSDPSVNLTDHNPVRYLRIEYDQQIEKMKKLGINVDSQLFEQCVNTLLWMVENRVWTLHPKEKKQEPKITRTPKVGDVVEIIGNIPFQLKDEPKPLLGTVTSVDGSYILVRPKYRRYECEFYPSELKIVKWKK